MCGTNSTSVDNGSALQAGQTSDNDKVCAFALCFVSSQCFCLFANRVGEPCWPIVDHDFGPVSNASANSSDSMLAPWPGLFKSSLKVQMEASSGQGNV